MFIGEYRHAVDDKFRMAVPSRFRSALKKGAVLTKGLDRCLVVYGQAEWKALTEKLAKLPISQANTRAFSRFLLSGAMDVELDKQGRMLLPDYLRQYAKLGRKVTIVGIGTRLEIWDEQEWDRYRSATEQDSLDIAEKLGEMAI
ncbi:MAG: division/cell wall cluster transcriptional repressor MraZ [Parcubacteria group bacterium]|nr:division/cell wall cluster transcriptional repressor MraZ [Parcubacteria group bacterium]